MKYYLLPALFVVLPTLLWNIVNQFIPLEVPEQLQNQKVTLLTAHPDDEVMFFGPTLQALLVPNNNNKVEILCLSNGNAEGLGAKREKELLEAVKPFGFTSDNVTIIDHPKIQDSMELEWDSRFIAEEILEQRLKDTTTVVTFDDQGVSSHPNHVAVYLAAVRWKAAEYQTRSVWVLKTVPVYRKYLALLDGVYTWVEKKFINPEAQLNTVVIVARQFGYEITKRAMIQGHRSQMKWYRWFYLQFSRYMVVNDLTEL
ncbi:N-acetylglucosaminyl-phosphatidylinositol de-N-acetylase [Trichomonascus vanleenenianus]|uniref:N-acetylglucosaminylphosphatidylinositol deacetylase n=1 Tax=Trichomonascus vanleenenianus TaxID=2268995 RepID=UPI003ECB7060